MKQPKAVVIPLVQELYENAIVHDEFKVHVRKVKVLFDVETINAYYETPKHKR